MTAAAFVIASLSVLEHARLSPLARLVWVRLKGYRNRQTGDCYPTHAELARKLNVSVYRIERAIRELRLAGLISSTNRKGRGNWYALHESPAHFQQPVDAEENAENLPKRPCKFAGSAPAPVQGQTQRPCRVTGPASLYELDVINQNKGTDAAAVKLEGVRKPVEKAAAAAQDCFAFENENEPQRPAPEALTMAEMVVAELMPQHPEPGNEGKAIAEAAKVLAAQPEAIETIRKNHAAYRAHWANFGPDRFIPQLQRWFRDGDWKHAPSERKGAQRESYSERYHRELEQKKEESCRMYAELDMWDAVRECGGDEAVEVWREKIQQAS